MTYENECCDRFVTDKETRQDETAEAFGAFKLVL
jgi:hypothetical protein